MKQEIKSNGSARALALEVLERCESGGYSSITLDTAIKRSSLSPVDRALLTALTYGTIERRNTLDCAISSLSTLPSEKIDTKTRCILRLGLYQLAYMDRIPDFAAINETVSLAPKRSRGFVNAILRSFVRRGRKIELPDEIKGDPVRHLSCASSVSESVARALLEIYSPEDCRKMLDTDRTAPITLRTNTLKCTRDDLLARLRERYPTARPTRLSPDGIILDSAAVTELVELTEGLATVQDEASQICVRTLGATPGDVVYDVCACPGSKSFGAAMTMENEGRILAFDIHKSKLSLVERGAERLGISVISVEAHDARDEMSELIGTADRVICDVPCSGLGVLAKKPEIRYKDMTECAPLPKIQLDILENVSKYLKVGGVLVYSTCTVLPAENEENIKNFLAAHGNFSLTPFSVGGLDAESGMITLLPHVHGTDGFFIARLTRNF